MGLPRNRPRGRRGKLGRALVAGDLNGAFLYHQPISGRENERWKLIPQGDGTFHLIDCKHGEALVAGDTHSDGNVYHQPPRGRQNAKWKLTRVPNLDMLSRDQHQAQGYAKAAEELAYLLEAYSPLWRFEEDEDYWPVDVESHLTGEGQPDRPTSSC